MGGKVDGGPRPVAGKKGLGVPMGGRMQGVAQTDEMRAAQPMRPQPTGWSEPYRQNPTEAGTYVNQQLDPSGRGFRTETWDDPRMKAHIEALRNPFRMQQPQQQPQLPASGQVYPWLRGF